MEGNDRASGRTPSADFQTLGSNLWCLRHLNVNIGSPGYKPFLQKSINIFQSFAPSLGHWSMIWSLLKQFRQYVVFDCNDRKRTRDVPRDSWSWEAWTDSSHFPASLLRLSPSNSPLSGSVPGAAEPTTFPSSFRWGAGSGWLLMRRRGGWYFFDLQHRSRSVFLDVTFLFCRPEAYAAAPNAAVICIIDNNMLCEWMFPWSETVETSVEKGSLSDSASLWMINATAEACALTLGFGFALGFAPLAVLFGGAFGWAAAAGLWISPVLAVFALSALSLEACITA